MADLRQIVFSQTGYFHDGIATESVVQHGARDIQSDLTGVFVDHCIDVTFSKASGAPTKPYTPGDGIRSVRAFGLRDVFL